MLTQPFHNTLGASIFNIVFCGICFSQHAQSQVCYCCNNFTVLVPTFFTIFAGIKADKTVYKTRWLIHFGYLQALLFVLVAFMTRSSSYLASFFSRLLLMNILSDIISDIGAVSNADFKRMFRERPLWPSSLPSLSASL